jgi:hypothetical protein
MRRATTSALEGGCSCGAVRYRLGATPLIVHACHCRECQRLTGSAFVINLWIERTHVDVTRGTPVSIRLKGASGKPHDVFHCADCATQLWSRYHVAGTALFVRGGTLDDPSAVRPDVHIYTRTKVPWLELPAGVPAFKAYYKRDQVWSAESKQRFKAARTA